MVFANSEYRLDSQNQIDSTSIQDNMPENIKNLSVEDFMEFMKEELVIYLRNNRLNKFNKKKIGQKKKH